MLHILLPTQFKVGALLYKNAVKTCDDVNLKHLYPLHFLVKFIQHFPPFQTSSSFEGKLVKFRIIIVIACFYHASPFIQNFPVRKQGVGSSICSR